MQLLFLSVSKKCQLDTTIFQKDFISGTRLLIWLIILEVSVLAEQDRDTQCGTHEYIDNKPLSIV